MYCVFCNNYSTIEKFSAQYTFVYILLATLYFIKLYIKIWNMIALQMINGISRAPLLNLGKDIGHISFENNLIIVVNSKINLISFIDITEV